MNVILMCVDVETQTEWIYGNYIIDALMKLIFGERKRNRIKMQALDRM